MSEIMHINIIGRSGEARQQDVRDTAIFLSMIFPIFATVKYLDMMKWGKWFKTFSPSIVHVFSILHNMGLHMFSVYIFANLFGTLVNHGIVNRPGYYFELPGLRRLLFLFYVSKYYEYMDTVLLLAKGKKPIFLQKFHHCGAVIVWHLSYVFSLDALFFISLINSGVHSIMYLYYLMSMFHSMRPMIREIKIYITYAQVGQLAFGFVMIPYYYYSIESTINKSVIVLFDLYIGVLLVLFTKFMVDSYFTGKKLIK
jgi:hypothetical protein